MNTKFTYHFNPIKIIYLLSLKKSWKMSFEVTSKNFFRKTKIEIDFIGLNSMTHLKGPIRVGIFNQSEFSMKVWYCLVLTLLFFVSLSETKRCGPILCDCPKVREPVCSVSGKTYQSPCIANCYKVWINLNSTL